MRGYHIEDVKLKGDSQRLIKTILHECNAFRISQIWLQIYESCRVYFGHASVALFGERLMGWLFAGQNEP